ncbi:unnamed protein product [Boreogadus saida]
MVPAAGVPVLQEMALNILTMFPSTYSFALKDVEARRSSGRSSGDDSQGILDLPDVITPSSRDVSSPPGRSSDVGEQSSKGTSEDTTLPDEDVLGNQMVSAVNGCELNEVETTGPPARTTEFSRPRRFSSLQCQPQRDEVSRLRASSGRSKTQQHQEALGLPNIGNSCFLNASLQCLYSLPCFCSDITGQEDLWSPRRRTKLKLLRYLGELDKSRQGEGSYKGKRRLLWSIKSSLADCQTAS